MNSVHYDVNGLRNSQIKTQIKNVLNDLDGVQKVNIDLGRGSVEVNYHNPASEEAIRQGIAHIGCSIK
jgi:copper chaperone